MSNKIIREEALTKILELQKEYIDNRPVDWEAQAGEPGFIENKPFGEVYDDMLIGSDTCQTETSSDSCTFIINNLNFFYGEDGNAVIPNELRLRIEILNKDNKVFFDGILIGEGIIFDDEETHIKTQNYYTMFGYSGISAVVDFGQSRQATITCINMKESMFDNDDTIHIELYSHSTTINKIDEKFIPTDSIISQCVDTIKILEFNGIIEEPITSINHLPYYNPLYKSFGRYSKSSSIFGSIWMTGRGCEEYMDTELIRPRTDVIFKYNNELYRFDTELDELVKFVDEGNNSSSNANWEAKEGEPGYISNKPFYEKVVTETLLDKTYTDIQMYTEPSIEEMDVQYTYYEANISGDEFDIFDLTGNPVYQAYINGQFYSFNRVGIIMGKLQINYVLRSVNFTQNDGITIFPSKYIRIYSPTPVDKIEIKLTKNITSIKKLDNRFVDGIPYVDIVLDYIIPHNVITGPKNDERQQLIDDLVNKYLLWDGATIYGGNYYKYEDGDIIPIPLNINNLIYQNFGDLYTNSFLNYGFTSLGEIYGDRYAGIRPFNGFYNKDEHYDAGLILFDEYEHRFGVTKVDNESGQIIFEYGKYSSNILGLLGEYKVDVNYIYRHNSDLYVFDTTSGKLKPLNQLNKIDEIDSILFDKPVGDTCDVVLVDNETLEKIVVKPYDLPKYVGTHTPIGVVVIPASHDVYGTGEVGIMSLLSASLTTPDEGQTSNAEIMWGQINVDTDLPNFSVIAHQGTMNGDVLDNIDGVCPYGYMPIMCDSVYGKDKESLTDPGTWYIRTGSGSYGYIPSPYLKDGSRNSLYYKTDTPSTPENAMSDFDGKSNTELLISLATVQEDWKTSESITHIPLAGYSPAACACWRFHTSGTSQGDWYLPACGELGYCVSRYDMINNTLSEISRVFGISVCQLNLKRMWTSTEQSIQSIRMINFDGGTVDYSGRTSAYGVRPFARMKLEEQKPKNRLDDHITESDRRLKELEEQILLLTNRIKELENGNFVGGGDSGNNGDNGGSEDDGGSETPTGDTLTVMVRGYNDDTNNSVFAKEYKHIQIASDENDRVKFHIPSLTKLGEIRLQKTNSSPIKYFKNITIDGSYVGDGKTISKLDNGCVYYDTKYNELMITNDGDNFSLSNGVKYTKEIPSLFDDMGDVKYIGLTFYSESTDE